MWIPQSLLSLFNISKEAVDAYRLETAELRATNAILERELISSRIMTDWLRDKVNQLNAERVQLIARAYPGLNLPAAEISRTTKRPTDTFDIRAIFEDQSEAHSASDPFAQPQ